MTGLVVDAPWDEVLAVVDATVGPSIRGALYEPGGRPRVAPGWVCVHAERDGLVVNAWSPSGVILPVGPRGIGAVVPWGQARPPAPWWWEQTMDSLSAVLSCAKDLVEAHATGRVCQVVHPVRSERCMRPAGHDTGCSPTGFDLHAVPGITWQGAGPCC